MSQETDTETAPVLELDREEYVPDWIVEQAVSLALQTQLREPILDAVRAADTVEPRSEAESVDVEAVDDSTEDGDADGGRGRLRGLIGLVVIGVGLFVAYKALSKRRQ